MFEEFWIKLTPILLEMVLRAKDIYLAPVFYPELIWVLLPVYANWVFVDFMSAKVEFSNAATTGFTYLWVGTSWLREYFKNLEFGFTVLADNMTLNVSKFLAVANPLELGIVGAMFFYGLIVMWFAVRGKEIGKVLGDIRTEAFVLISLTPILFRKVSFDIVTVTAILFSAIVFYIIIEIAYRLVYIKKNTESNKN